MSKLFNNWFIGQGLCKILILLPSYQQAEEASVILKDWSLGFSSDLGLFVGDPPCGPDCLASLVHGRGLFLGGPDFRALGKPPPPPAEQANPGNSETREGVI